MEYIERSVEELVRASDSTFKCVLVTGAWQTGKSTMFKAPFPDKKYVPTNDPFIEEQANENPNMFMMLNPSPAFYDEVQRAPGLFRFIKVRPVGLSENLPCRRRGIFSQNLASAMPFKPGTETKRPMRPEDA